VPVAASGEVALASLTVGSDHTCGLTASGAAYCWGGNSSGQLGDGTTLPRRTPVPVLGGLTFTSLTAGYGFTCGVTGNGGAYCWGGNPNGQLGDGSTTNRLAPVAVANP
jgi:alpha-tubulin suppressor-like RCC1 family protein